MHITKTLALRGSDQIAHDNGAFDVITSAIESVDLNKLKKKISKEKARAGASLFSPIEINRDIKKNMNSQEWFEYKKKYFISGDKHTDDVAWDMPYSQQEKFIKERGFEAIFSHTESDFLKNRTVVEVQMGKYPFVSYDIYLKNQVLYVNNQVDLAIEVLPTKNLERNMSGPAYFESLSHRLNMLGEDYWPKVPTLILGIE